MLLDTLSSLIKLGGAAVSRLPIGRFERVLKRGRKEARESILKRPEPLKKVRKILRAVRSRSEYWHVGRHGWSVLGPGLERTYSLGRRAFAQARARRSDECLHEWRKQIQYFWHQLRIFEPLGAGPLANLVEETHQLADCLGNDHDLAVLRARAAGAREVFPSAAAHRGLIALIERCRTGLQTQAFELGRRVYDEKPAALTARLGRQWQHWRHCLPAAHESAERKIVS